MNTKRAVGWARLNELIAEIGEDGLLDLICTRVAGDANNQEKPESLRQIAKNEAIPYGHLWRWLAGDPQRMWAYNQVTEGMIDAEAMRIITIADEATKETVDTDKVRIDARKWMATKLAEQRYGDKSKVTHAGTPGAPITVIERVIIDASPKTPDA
jgi:hypothetical protein